LSQDRGLPGVAKVSSARASNETMNAPAWLETYARSVRRGHDELLDAHGQPRPAWRKLMEELTTMGEPELGRRWEHARTLLREHGVSYNAYGDAEGVTRAWNLSPIPVMVEAAEWARVSEGLAQRARLLDEILADLYGPRRLLAAGDIPAELVLANPLFLRPCVGVEPPGRHYLPLYAADIARDPEGHFRVLADRTQAPSGAGYVIENRIILARALTEVFGECGVTRLAVFFRTMRDMLRRLAPHNRDNPRIALLTPGPYNATYFEQAFFAQYLGLMLVQGGDLTVRDHRVYLKTLGGLLPVDVILRRMNDDYCDPLELRSDSPLGIPGLVEVARAGNVAIVNPLGSGILQSPSFLPFLPALCRKLHGEELKLPSVRTYWCGDPGSLREVLARLSDMVIRPALPTESEGPVFARELSSAALGELTARIRARPEAYVAQEELVLSAVPTLVEGELAPAHLWMRAFLAVSQDDYEVMPGALSRVGGPGETLALSLRPGGESKDTWVLAGGPVNTFTMLAPERAKAELSRGGGDLPSRIADDLFWLGRYAERSESTARLARAIGAKVSDQHAGRDVELAADLDALFGALATRTGLAHPASEKSSGSGRTFAAAAAESCLIEAVFGDTTGSLHATIAQMYRVARLVRDRISADTWRTIADLEQDLRRHEGITGPGRMGVLTSLLNRVIGGLAAISGLVMDSMTRGQAWRFLDMGRRLERGMHIVSLLRDAGLAERAADPPLLEALLDVADSAMTYRRRYLAKLELAPVVDLLLTDQTNPRSVLFQVTTLAEHVDALPAEPGAPASPLQKILLAATAELRLSDIDHLAEPDDKAQFPSMAALLERLTHLLSELSNAVSGAYLNHATVSRHLYGGKP
jgi:uncharacterized circularly permuted ATP-grasp superfamily protein/uncharacterized alpha-E superfamily protein